MYSAAFVSAIKGRWSADRGQFSLCRSMLSLRWLCRDVLGSTYERHMALRRESHIMRPLKACLASFFRPDSSDLMLFLLRLQWLPVGQACSIESAPWVVLGQC